MMTKLFKFTAISEGISFILLLANMLINKTNNPFLYKKLLFPIGMAHGILFMAYIILAFIIMKKQSWKFKELAIVLAASFIPFGTFYVEKKYLKHD